MSIVDEMARAIGQDMWNQDLCADDDEVTYQLPEMARAVAAVVARRLREALRLDGDDSFPSHVGSLIDELEGGT